MQRCYARQLMGQRYDKNSYAGATVAALADDGTVAINFAVTSRGAGAMSLVVARLPAGGAPASGCLEVWNPRMNLINLVP